jgi:MFS family permease
MSNEQFTMLWSITNGLMPLGGLMGSLLSGFVADYMGRRRALMVSNSLTFVSMALSSISKPTHTYETLMASRFVGGFLVGLFSGIVPLYLAEIAPQNLRGLIGSINSIMITVGILASNVVGLPYLLGTDALWPVLLGFMIVPGLVLLVGLVFIVETPKYLLIKQNNLLAARGALMKLRGPGNVDQIEREIDLLTNEQLSLSTQITVRYVDLIKQRLLRRAIMIAVIAHVAQRLSGINAVSHRYLSKEASFFFYLFIHYQLLIKF